MIICLLVWPNNKKVLLCIHCDGHSMYYPSGCLSESGIFTGTWSNLLLTVVKIVDVGSTLQTIYVLLPRWSLLCVFHRIIEWKKLLYSILIWYFHLRSTQLFWANNGVVEHGTADQGTKVWRPGVSRTTSRTKSGLPGSQMSVRCQSWCQIVNNSTRYCQLPILANPKLLVVVESVR